MQSKSVKSKSERPDAGQKRSASATKKSRVASETGLTTAASLATGLLAETGDLAPSNAAPTETAANEAAPTESATLEAVPAQGAMASADPDAATTEGETATEVAAPLAVVPAGESREVEATKTIPAEPTQAEPVAALPAPPVEESAEQASAEQAVSNTALPTTRPGLVQSPLAARMLAEAAGREAGKGGRTSRAVDHSLGAEFAQADGRVKDLKAQLNAARSRVQGKADPAVAAQITALRKQIRASRGSKIEGIAPFDAAIATAREALNDAKSAKRKFLASQGIGVPGPTSGGPSLQQQLNALRSRIKEGADEAESAELTRLRADYRQAKADRVAAREKALAPLPTLAEAGVAEHNAHAADSEPVDDATTNDTEANHDAVADDVTGNDMTGDDMTGEAVSDAENDDDEDDEVTA